MLKKLWTILMGLFRQSGEAVIDKNAHTLIDQQIYKAEQAIRAGESSLVNLMTDQDLNQKKAAELTLKLKEYEGTIVQLQAKQSAEATKTALKVAERFAEVEAELETLKGTISRGETSIKKINDDIKQSKKDIADRKRRLSESTAKSAQISILKEVSVASADANSDLRQAAEAQDRLEARQDRELARFSAAEQYHDETSGASLDRELEALGVKQGTQTAESVLARFAAKPTAAE